MLELSMNSLTYVKVHFTLQMLKIALFFNMHSNFAL